MAPIRSITVTVRMNSGELRAGLELRAVVDQDALDIEELLASAKLRGLYDEETKILGWNGLGGSSLFWPGVGATDRDDFEKMRVLAPEGL